MKTRRRFLSVTIALVVALALTAGLAAAGSSTIPFLETDAGCETLDPGTEWITGDFLHVRNRKNLDRVLNVTGFGSDGWMPVTVNYSVNLVTLKGFAFGTFHRMYDDIDGSFTGRYAGPINDGLYSGKAFGIGQGGL